MSDEHRASMKEDGEVSLSEEELAEAEAALTLAFLPDGDRLPTKVRERVEADARSFFGQRAKVHAIRRADNKNREGQERAARGAGAASSKVQSTTSAGAHVVTAFDESPKAAPRSTSLLGWAGWGLAAAACLALFVSQSRTPSRAPGSGVEARSDRVVDRLSLTGAGVGDGRARGELRYDRALGTGQISITDGPQLDGHLESLQLWIAFDGDASPRAIALLEGATELSFGAGRQVCQSPAASILSGPRCAAVRDVVVTREDKRGTLVFVADRVVLRGGRTP